MVDFRGFDEGANDRGPEGASRDGIDMENLNGLQDEAADLLTGAAGRIKTDATGNMVLLGIDPELSKDIRALVEERGQGTAMKLPDSFDEQVKTVIGGAKRAEEDRGFIDCFGHLNAERKKGEMGEPGADIKQQKSGIIPDTSSAPNMRREIKPIPLYEEGTAEIEAEPNRDSPRIIPA